MDIMYIYLCLYVYTYFYMFIYTYIYKLYVIYTHRYISFNSMPIQNGRRDKVLSPKCFYYHRCFGNGIC